MATLTVPGSQSITAYFCDDELDAAQQALANLEQGFNTIQVLSTTTVTPMPLPGVLYLFNVTVPGNGLINPPFGGYGTILADDVKGATINAVGSRMLVIGNDQDDSISLGGGGTMYTADGGEYIGSGTVIVGAGNDTIDIKGDATVFACDGNDSINVQLGNASITVGTGNDTITLGGAHDTVSLGGPNDTVTAAGSATVMGPSGIQATVVGGKLTFGGDTGGANESVTAGSGNATLLGGNGITFIGGTGNVLMQGTVGGGGNDTYFGGSGNDTMVAGHGAGGTLGNLFNFDTGATPEGGQHMIQNFTQGQDTIHLGAGYNVTNIVNGSDPNNYVTTDGSGNTVLVLDAGSVGGPTTVTFVGLHTPLHTGDFN